MLEDFSLIPIEFGEADVEELEAAVLPPDWAAHPVPAATQSIGDRWVFEQRSAILRIPSVIVSHESNYLLNPGHPRFGEVSIGEPRPFPFDPRLH